MKLNESKLYLTAWKTELADISAAWSLNSGLDRQLSVMCRAVGKCLRLRDWWCIQSGVVRDYHANLRRYAVGLRSTKTI